jgi:CubicO group peptidase (beta-lactamase class C family)
VKTHAISAALLAAALSPAAFAQAADDPATKIDALFAKASIETPGCAVGIAKGGETVLERAYGAADLEHAVVNTTATVFESGSVAKQFTAAAILLLEKDGKLKLTDDIRKHLPEMPNYGAPITIDMLLHHTSGLRDWDSVSTAAGQPRGERSFTNAEVLDIAARQKALNYKPGAEYAYTNTGYNLAAIIVERVSGKSFQDFTKERIFAPLGMTHSSWRDDFSTIVKNRAMAYGRIPGGYVQAMPFMNVYGNGGMLTTVGDFLIWNEALSSDKLGVTKALETRGVLNDGREIMYARGIEIHDYRGLREISHSGSTGGYITWLARYPGQQLSVAMLCNGPPPREFSHPHQLADAWLPATQPSAQPAAATVDPTPFTGMFINASTGFPAQLSVKDGALQFAPSGGPTLPIAISSGARWTVGGGARPDGGAVTFTGKDRFTHETADGNRYDYARKAAAALTPAQLTELTGRYASDEAGATYRVATENGKLVIRIDHWPESVIELEPSYKDAFLDGYTLVRFYRNKAGRITEMSIADNRMRDLRAPRLK